MKSNQCYARDIIISKSLETPKNLVFSPKENTAGFFTSFITNANSDILKKISDVCNQKEKEDIEIHFMYKAGSRALTIPLPTDSRYEAYKNLLVEVGGNINKISIGSNKISYLTVTFLG